MSPPELPPPLRHYSGGQIALIVIGIILILPGACSLVFMAQMAGEVRWSDPYVQIIIALWAVCFAVSAIGVVLIVVARRRAGAAS
jgi:hypothetical protein